MNKWVTVATSNDRNKATELFEKWKIENPMWSNKLSENDIRIDTIRTADKTVITRYCVKQK